jgi:hypothetical protein
MKECIEARDVAHPSRFRPSRCWRSAMVTFSFTKAAATIRISCFNHSDDKEHLMAAFLIRE